MALNPCHWALEQPDSPSLASGESAQRLTGDLNSQNKIQELLEEVAVIVVTTGWFPETFCCFHLCGKTTGLKLQPLELNLGQQLIQCFVEQLWTLPRLI